MKNKKHSQKDIIRTFITGFILFCVIAGSVFRFIDKEISDVLLTIYNIYVIICIVGAFSIILLLLFLGGHIKFNDRSKFIKSLLIIFAVLIPMLLMIIPIIIKMI